MSLNAEATNRFFKGLKCPYTGKKITVRVVAHGKHKPMYFSPDAYDPTMPHGSIKELLEKTSTRNGIIGYLPPGKERVCAYTGNALTLAETGSMFSFTGGFSPRTPNADPLAFARMLWTRNGKFTGDEKLFAKTRITTAEREPGEESSTPSTSPSDLALKTVEPIIASKFKKTSVSVPAGVPKKK